MSCSCAMAELERSGRLFSSSDFGVLLSGPLKSLYQRVSAEVCSLESNLGHLEAVIGEETREAQRVLLETACQRKADGFEPRCPRCGSWLSRVTGGHERTVASRFGPIRIVRQRGWCGQCARWVYPADEGLGLRKNAGASPGVQEAAALAVSKMPAGEAAAVVERLSGMRLSRSMLDREAHRQGQRALEQRHEMDEQALSTTGRWEVTAQVKRELGRAPFTLVIQIDAWNIRERDAWGQSAALAEQGAPVNRWHWVYGATVFRLGERAETQSGRKMILSRGYVMTRQGTDALAEQVFAEAVRQGLLLARDVLVIADGGVWIWRLAEDRFPWARKRLDFYHASEHLWAVAHELHGTGTAQARQWVEPLLRQLRHGGEAGVLQTLEELKYLVQESHRPLVEREANYFLSHKDHLDYQAGAQAGEPIGSGAMESTCRQYQCRFKRPGQFWSQTGDEQLLALETFWRNARWHMLFPHAGKTDPNKN